MKRFLKILLGLAVIAGFAIGAVLYATSDDRELVREFILQASSGQAAEAETKMHSSLKLELPAARLAQAFSDTRPYVEVSFSSVETSGGATTLKGVAKTADGCASEIAFKVLEDQITSFSIQPLCR